MVICVVFSATPASAASKSVACHANDLVEAIKAATDGDILSLAPDCTYLLTKAEQTQRYANLQEHGYARVYELRALPHISKALTIEGNGATIRPQQQEYVFEEICDTFAYAGNCLGKKEHLSIIGPNPMGIFTVNGTLTLRNLTLSNGQAALGGAIFQTGGKVFLESVTIANSYAPGEFDRFARDGYFYSKGRGGAIYQFGGTLSLTDSTIHDVSAENLGGSIYSEKGTLDLIRTRIEKSSSGHGGGGLYIANSTVRISDSPLNNNFTQYNNENFQKDYHLMFFGRIGLENPPKPASSNGGAIYLNSGSLTLSGALTKIFDNAVVPTHIEDGIILKYGLDVPAGSGGGIYAREGASLTVANGATITDNKPDNCNSVIAASCGQ